MYTLSAQDVYEIREPHYCVRRVYIRRCIDFSPRVDASDGADGFRTLVVVVVATAAAAAAASTVTATVVVTLF